jgi:hypothetical protein
MRGKSPRSVKRRSAVRHDHCPNQVASRRADMPGKRVQFDEETWHALNLLARDQMKTFQELADEAFEDLLKKHNRPVNLKDTLHMSVGRSATIYQFKPGKKAPARKKLTPAQGANASSLRRRHVRCHAWVQTGQRRRLYNGLAGLSRPLIRGALPARFKGFLGRTAEIGRKVLA